MTPPLGVIEGYYGLPWAEATRLHVVAFLKKHGYGFYFYAPKADAHLRKRWREPYPAEAEARLRRLSQHCRSQGVAFGVGLSPYELYRAFDDEARRVLGERLAWLDAIPVDILAILFDDMRGDVPALAETQAEILHWIMERTKASRIVFCPSYYSDDAVLDRVFGARPKDYLEDLGRLLDPAIEIFWTGEEVCSREFSVGHLERVSAQLRRKPFLWDNYPVNDGARMSQFLHVRAFTGRPAAIQDHISAHAINPALQPTLSLIPAMTLAEGYAAGPDYAYGAAFARAAEKIAGAEIAKLICEDVIFLQDTGLDRLGERKDRLRERYARFPDSPAALEIVAWLDGAYRFAGDLD